MNDAVIETDFVITLAGRDVTKDATEWELIESAKKMSRVSVTLKNENEKNDGIADIGTQLSIRYAENGEWEPGIQFPVMEDKADYDSKAPPTLWFCGYDESEKLGGGKHKGNFDKDMQAKEIAEDICKHLGLKLDGSADGPKFVDQPFSVMNEKWWQVLYRLQKQMRPKKGKGKAGRSPFPKDKAGKPRRFHGQTNLGDSGAAVGRSFLPKREGKELDENLAGNNASSAAGEPVTASLSLKGFPPRLRADGCLTMLNVGSKYSGKWYVEEIKRSCKVPGGSRTDCSLLRSGVGKGDAGDRSPVMSYAKIHEKQPTLSMGPRNLDGESQATFTFGAGERVISFKPHTKPQSQRGGGEGGKGQMDGVDLLNSGDPYQAKADDSYTPNPME